MEKLVIFRMFLCFPLLGSILPDAGVWISNKSVTIPTGHLIIEATLILLIAICSVRISILKKRHSDTTELEINEYSEIQ